MVRDPKKDEAKANFSADLAQARKDSEDATVETQVAPHVDSVDSEFPPEAKHCPMCGEEFCKLLTCKWIWGVVIIALTAWYFWGKG